MALTTCRECGGKVSTTAETCPHCGVGSPGSTEPAHAPPPTAVPAKSGAWGCLAVVGIALAVIFVIAVINGNSSDPTGCRSDWTKCADNSDLVNNYSDWTSVQVDCKYAANKLARYGTPEWPWLSFGKFISGSDYVKTGMAVAIEDDALFQNGFGAKVHSRVRCSYDLRAKRVIDVSVSAK